MGSKKRAILSSEITIFTQTKVSAILSLSRNTDCGGRQTLPVALLIMVRKLMATIVYAQLFYGIVFRGSDALG